MQEAEITSREGDKLPEERIIEIEMERLRDFRNHPFRISADKPMGELMESIQRYGVLNPLIVSPMPEGVYEIISGHRRKYAAQMLGFRKVPVVIRVMSDDETIIEMVDSNLQRQQIYHSEKALAIKMKYEAMKRIRCLVSSEGEKKIIDLVEARREKIFEERLATGTDGIQVDRPMVNKRFTPAQKEMAAYGTDLLDRRKGMIDRNGCRR